MAPVPNPKIHIHHIGGRNGSHPFPTNEHFATDYVLSIYDGDDTCMPSMAGNDGQERRIFAQCFAEKEGSINFNVNYDPYTSSILNKNKEFDDAYFHKAHFDYVNGDARRQVKVIELEAITLDQHSATLTEAIDFLGLDVEGAEMNIMAGGRQTIAQDVLGVTCEVMFYELLEGQKIFGDLCAFMNSSGFRFVQMTPHEDGYAFSRRPIGWRARGVTITGDALFLKDPGHVLTTHPDPDLGLAKLAFMALNFDLLEYALDALELIAESSVLAFRTGTYGQFLHELRTAYKGAPFLLPTLFSDLFTAEESADRFGEGGMNYQGGPMRLREKLLPPYTKDEFKRAISVLWKGEDTELEALLREANFSALVENVRKNRHNQIINFMMNLGFVTKSDDTNYAADWDQINSAAERYCKS
jgi:FkbM family methyltransferase